MRPISEFSAQEASQIIAVFTDIDDTLTTDGELPSAAYTALEELRAAGIFVAAITGRPAGWCDMIARFWPVDGVVGENGAFYFAYDKTTCKMRREYFADAFSRQENQKKLDHIQKRVLSEVPGCAISSDQAFRIADLAIDFCEDVAALEGASISRIKEIFEEEGAVAKISSIHVNGWFGDYDKLSMSRRFAREILDINLDVEKENVIFCGDSPNDVPMFNFFPNSCGVANVMDFKDNMEHQPTWLASQRGGQGFVEIAQTILSARKSKMA